MTSHRASSRWAGGSTAAWRRVRAYVLDRDGHRCRLRLDVCTHTATQAHHLSPREIVGDDPRYIIAACAPCNQKAGAPEKSDPESTTDEWWNQ